MNYPTHLQYSKSHEWIHTEDGVAVIGISDFAQHALGDVVFVNLPGEGDEVTAGEAFGEAEEVRHHVLMFTGKHPAGAPESSHDFIAD